MAIKIHPHAIEHLVPHRPEEMDLTFVNLSLLSFDARTRGYQDGISPVDAGLLRRDWMGRGREEGA